MNRTKKLVVSVSTLLRQNHPLTFRCNPLATIAIKSQTHLGFETLEPFSANPLTISIRGLRFSGRVFCSESGEKRRSSVCWNCGLSSQKAAFLFCDSCRSIQPVDDSVDYFQIFGLEKKYDIDGKSLEGKYKDWQKKLHPDLVHNKSKMKLNGISINEEETLTDPEVLMEIMELRQAIAEANDSKALNEIQSQVQEKLKQWSDSFVEAFESQSFDEAVKCTQRMTYYERASEEIVKKL